jgi:type II secretory pathway pseudopilin PulG
MKLHRHLRRKTSRSRQQGYILIVMMLFLTLLAISLTAAAPAMMQRIRREREIELIHRGNQYARAIRLYYRKFGRYPVRLEELENTNNIRFLRKRYKDPMTAGGHWRLIHFGEAQLTQPNAAPVLPGATTPGSPGFAGVGSTSSPFANTFSSSPQPGSGQAGTSTAQGQAGTSTAQGQAGTTQTQPDTTTPSQTGATQPASADSSQSSQSGQSGPSGQPGQPGTPASQLGSPLGGPTFGGGPVVGVASTSKKQSIKELNTKNHYNDWEFVFDPRLDVTMAQPAAGLAGQNPLAPTAQAPGVQPTTSSPGMPGMQPTKTQ